VHRQLRALSILDGLIQNAGTRFQRTFADEPLLERLRVAGTDPVTDPDVRAKAKQLFGQWSVAYKGTAGLGGIAGLYAQLPKKKRPVASKDPAAEKPKSPVPEPPRRPSVSNSTPSTSATSPSSHRWSSFSSSQHVSSLVSRAKPDKNSKTKPFSLEKEKPAMMQALANASVASTNLLNALRRINRETERVSENAEAKKHFETCRTLRRQILRYIQNVESDQYLGSLIHANEELVTALRNYEILDKSVEDDSDSETEPQSPTTNAALSSSPRSPAPIHALAGLNLNASSPPSSPPIKPPRPTSISMPPRPDIGNGKARAQNNDFDDEEQAEEDDEDDPFADRNAVNTPAVEKELRWKEV
jgi:hypothetical protein